MILKSRVGLLQRSPYSSRRVAYDRSTVQQTAGSVNRR